MLLRASAMGKHAHDAYHRFLRVGAWRMTELWRTLVGLLVTRLPPAGVLLVDLERPPLPAIALTVNTSSLMAIGNDYSFDLVFARQLEAMAAPGDVAIGISTSGNAENVLQAVRLARAKGVITVGLSGRHGGRLRDAVDHCLCVPSEDTPRIQECHILIGHLLCEIVERALCGQA